MRAVSGINSVGGSGQIALQWYYITGARMTLCFSGPKRRQIWSRLACLAIAGIALVTLSETTSFAASRNDKQVQSADRVAGEPVMAIVSLRSQRVTIYDADGWILQAPVSSGQRGRETPSGVFAVIEKEAEHYSNLYDDASMPHMQRITWSGIALHGGPLPGYAASHGCIRMPYDFAEQLFDETKVGMRVIVAPRDSAPVEIAHPALFHAKLGAEAVAAARASEAAEATSKADQAKVAAAAAARELARSQPSVRVAENLKLRVDTLLAAAERAVASASSDEAKAQAEEAKTKVAARVAEVEAQLAAAQTELQPKLDAANAARQAAEAAESARVAAADAAREAARALKPISVFISRKTQRLYVRQAFQPIFESPVSIRDADRPIGTHVFTALGRVGDNDLRWSVVSLDSDAAGARDALDRISIPQDALDRIGASPRSSLIVSDEELSRETGKGTDFIVIMSNEPQGGIAFRRHSPAPVAEFRYAPRNRSWNYPFGGTFSRW
jgi:hypothetical protein